MLEIKTVTNGPITKYLQRVCHGTLLSLISFSLRCVIFPHEPVS